MTKILTITAPSSFSSPRLLYTRLRTKLHKQFISRRRSHTAVARGQAVCPRLVYDVLYFIVPTRLSYRHIQTRAVVRWPLGFFVGEKKCIKPYDGKKTFTERFPCTIIAFFSIRIFRILSLSRQHTFEYTRETIGFNAR